jgi:protein TonB
MASSLRPALAGSLALHALALVAGLIAFPKTPIKMTTSVPVTIVSKAPTPDLRPAIEAPEVQEAAAPEVVEVAPPVQPPAPAPTPPSPAPPRSAPPPPPPATKAAPSPTPRPAPALDLDALAKNLPKRPPRPRQPALDLDRLAAPQARRNAAAQAETAPQARPAVGAAQGLTADEGSLLAAKLIRLWRPNCVAEGGANIEVRVNIQLTPTGDLATAPRIVGGQQNNALWQAAAQRALSAVRQGEPYDELPRTNRPRDFNINFNARQACLGM